MLWRDRIGYEPSFFLVGTVDEWEHQPRAAIILDELRHHELHVEFVDHIPGAEDGTIAQCVRQHAAAHPYPEDDILMPSDADLLPIRREFYHQHDPEKHAIGLYYWNGYPGEEDRHWPSCHMSMRVRTWREVMGLDVPLREAMVRNFSDYNLSAKMAAKRADPGKNWGHVWFTDEFIASLKVKESRYHPHGINFITREGHPPKDRLDRSAWPAQYDVTQYTDVHSIRPIWNAVNWPRFRPIIEQTMPDKLAWADRYISDFRKVMEG
jgi:hypothetical protein